MVSSEGACAAYYQYGGVKRQQPQPTIEGAV
jgi:hydrogenase maturation factor